jgi:2-polyprenyl-3-methyl-5-hydroxy-6-metoxy-1,4-benzoquinol methylase
VSYLIDPEGIETGVIHELVDFSGADVLEVGCGDGRLTWRYAEKTTSVLGLDPDEEEIRKAIEATPPFLRSKVRFLVSDVTDHELPSDAYDVVILAHSL